MTAQAINIHATSIVLGTQGFLFVGASGAGKSSTALSCIAAARREGIFAALIADDQTLARRVSGRLIASSPPSIRGLVEVRGAGIVPCETIPAAIICAAILPVEMDAEPRLPLAHERFAVCDGSDLPLFRLPVGRGADSLAFLQLILPENLRIRGLKT